MKWLMIVFCALCVALPPALSAQDADTRAQRIKSRDEYKGYRVDRQPGSDYELDGSNSSRDGERSEVRSGPRRSADAAPQRGSRSQRSGGGSSSGSLGSMPGWVGGLFKVLAWIVVIGAVAVALFFIVKALMGVRFKRKPKSEKSRKSKNDDDAEEEPEDEDEAFDPSVFEDALATARKEYDEALNEGDFARATLLAYRIFWLRAGWEGCVQDRDVRTWRDALRMVRRRDTRRHVRTLLPLVERVRYADYRPGREEFQNWQLKVEQVNPAEVLK